MSLTKFQFDAWTKLILAILLIRKAQQDQTELRGFDYRELLASVEGHAAASLFMTPALLHQGVAHHSVLTETWVQVECNARVITQVDAEPGKLRKKKIPLSKVETLSLLSIQFFSSEKQLYRGATV